MFVIFREEFDRQMRTIRVARISKMIKSEYFIKLGGISYTRS